MMGAPGDQGVVPRAIQALFDRISNTEDWCVTCFLKSTQGPTVLLVVGRVLSASDQNRSALMLYPTGGLSCSRAVVTAPA